jgi:hypothetical protein
MPSVEESPSSRGRVRFQRQVYETPVVEVNKRKSQKSFVQVRVEQAKKKLKMSPNKKFVPRSVPSLPTPQDRGDSSSFSRWLDGGDITHLDGVDIEPVLAQKGQHPSTPPPREGAPDATLHRVTKTNVAFTPTGNNRCEDVEDPATAWFLKYPLDCKVCKISKFKSESLYATHHKSTHQVDRPWKCQYLGCTSAFRQIPHYKEHIRGTHNPEVKSFKCIFCEYRCATASQLTNHRAKQHSTFACPTCSNKFNSDRALFEHQEKRNHFIEGEPRPSKPVSFPPTGSYGKKMPKKDKSASSKASPSMQGVTMDAVTLSPQLQFEMQPFTYEPETSQEYMIEG